MWFILGFVGGFIFAVVCMSRLWIGTLKHVTDDDGTYFYMEVKNPNIDKIIKKKYVILDISHK